MILQSGEILELENLHPLPDRGFMMSGKDLTGYGDDLAATWHTHPTTPAYLSQDDYLGFGYWPDILHYIAGTDGVRVYEVDSRGLISEKSLAND